MKKEFLEQSILGTMLEEKTDTPKEMNILELIVAKTRNGPTGTAYSFYNRMTEQIREKVQG